MESSSSSSTKQEKETAARTAAAVLRQKPEEREAILKRGREFERKFLTLENKGDAQAIFNLWKTNANTH